ncbi:hypothetical protein COL922a_010103 [Colletotrichum nupharicola]|nr:hypothetical protein COL922a_010103 [Colletotrichum nupharicola]
MGACHSLFKYFTSPPPTQAHTFQHPRFPLGSCQTSPQHILPPTVDRLPQEIVDDIISHRFIDEIIHPYRPKLRLISRFATVSRGFQYAIERLLFRTIEISNLDNYIQMFESLFSTSPYRRDFIKRVTLRIQLDEYLQRIIRIYYKALDMDQAGREEFRAVSETLLILSAWTDRQAIRLTISCQTWGKVVPGGIPVKGQHRCQEFTVIELPDLDTLPAAPCIRSLEITCIDASPQVHPFSVLTIAKACPKLADLILAHADPYSYDEFEFLDEWEHPDSKIAFQLPTHNFSKVYIDHPVCFWFAQLMDFVTARYHASFCVTMHNVVNNFARLDYHGILEPSFFWPYGPSEQPAPFRQNMTYMWLQVVGHPKFASKPEVHTYTLKLVDNESAIITVMSDRCLICGQFGCPEEESCYAGIVPVSPMTLILEGLIPP